MSLAKPIIFFVHGLNTFGDDRLHLGPLVFGPMDLHLRRALEKSGLEFHTIQDMGHGALDDQADRAATEVRKFLAADRSSSEATAAVTSSAMASAATSTAMKRTVHLLGHSMGGIVARGVASRLLESRSFTERNTLASVMTIGTPHRGADSSLEALNLKARSPILYQILKLAGYDLEKKREPLGHFALEKIETFGARHPERTDMSCLSFIGTVRPEDMSWPLRIVDRRLNRLREPSDGLVMSASQVWARSGGIFALDHYAQLGFLLFLDSRRRRNARREFERLTEAIIQAAKG